MEKCLRSLLAACLLALAIISVSLSICMHGVLYGNHRTYAVSAGHGQQREQPLYRKVLKCPFGRDYPQSFRDRLPRVSASMRRVYVETPWGAPIVWSFTVDINATARLHSGPFSVGLVVAAIDKYVVFLERLIGSADRYFMNSQKVTYFVFTDNPDQVSKIQSNRTIVVLEEKDRGWPHNSMLRFAMMQSHWDQFQGMDFIFCIDVDVIFHDEVDAEALEYRVATLHPLHYAEKRSKFPYDTNPLSTAYVKLSEGSYYYSGAFFGGCRDEINHMSDVIQANIWRDFNQGSYTASWHDESHLNRYLIDHPPTKLLSSEYYCFESHCDRLPSARIKSPEDSAKQVLKMGQLTHEAWRLEKAAPTGT